ncbi:Ni/Fe hydrogenase subunit gamma [Thiohalorhabdus denitrificans]|uniref:NAD(P)H-flavin reductase n=1 Tax=Thiohalorhabdus denitrificans TaxID=381306 RepID=A0A0N8PMU2_9GAMM|nr:FAD/NAD(P)-binding protein [Thiohalorhabdus denitrificans]KPV39677.1 Ni/Fe hydrogenase subunit gamma [Thiohalorhabdus denitrificans]SCX94397.1 NAD(P)H-flavin reductase [Thiohalorhabdus denitrificans]
MRRGGAWLPREAEVAERVEESPGIVTLRLRLTDPEARRQYGFQPGQFNMLGVFGVGEVAISISSDPGDPERIGHTIRRVGRVTNPLVALDEGDRLGLRGPFGRGWPLDRSEGRDVLVVTGGLGCAPVVSVIEYIMARRSRFGRLTILQGVKHGADLIWRPRYEAWARDPDTEVGLAADVPGENWPGHVGLVTELFDRVRLRPGRTAVMMCGPEPMMRAGARELVARGFPADDLWLSLERNHHCGNGRCGHCQLGPYFVCHDGPVFAYSQVGSLLAIPGL